tara:strand:+ start:330 stop:788 length:459 start_codon:yes stop_codon:yes gene_type:complete
MADTSLFEINIGLLIWKNSNLWQSRLRQTLHPFNLSLNEYLILKSIKDLSEKKLILNQNKIALNIGIDISVTSVTIKLLESKFFIDRNNDKDSRKKNIILLDKGLKILESANPLIELEEKTLFNKLNNETFNFTNSLKLLLGKKIRIKAKKI